MPVQKTRLTIIVSILILAISVVIFLNLSYLKSLYPGIIIFPHFNIGDKIYLRKTDLLTGKAFDKDNQFVLARLIKPYTDKEIDTMQIDDKAKAVLKVKADSVSSSTPYAIYTRDAIAKYDNTGVAGIYQGRIRLHSKKSNCEDVVQLFYIIKPDSKALTISPYKFDLPSGYVYANKLYYISPFPLSNDPLD